MGSVTTLAELSAIVALITSAILVAVSAGVVWSYRRHIAKPKSTDQRWRWLAHGACVGFLAVGLTAAWWGMKWVFILTGNQGAASFIGLYGGLVDPFVRGLSIWAGIAHLMAAGWFK